MRLFYGFQFEAGRSTTSGRPNSWTGRMSTAGWLVVFSSKKDRAVWVAANDGREAVTAREARNLCSGLSDSEFQEYLQDLKRDLEVSIEEEV